jgi:HlyD family secretion protein
MANQKSKRGRKILIFCTIGLVVVGLVLTIMFRRREAAITIQSEKVGRRNLTELVVANGRIQPVVQVKISPEVSGEIIELPVKEGQRVKKGDLLVKIKPDTYQANRRSAEANFKSALAGKSLSAASLKKAEIEFKRVEELFGKKLVSDSTYVEFKTAVDVATATQESSGHQVEVAQASLARAEEDLAKTTIYSPLTGTVSKLNSEAGERVVGTAMMTGTEIMTVADLNEMEARVDIGEIDVVLIAVGQNARLEIDAFKDRKFTGTVTEIANSSKGSGPGAGNMGGGQQQEATKFEVRLRVKEKEPFRPGMSVTAEIETRSRTNVLAVPIQSVTTRLPKEPAKKSGATNAPVQSTKHAVTNHVASANTASVPTGSGSDFEANSASSSGGESNGSSTNQTTAVTETNRVKSSAKVKPNEPPKPIEVVFLVDGDRAKMAPIKRGISDDTYVEITEGLRENQEVVSGGYKAISRDLEDGKKIKKGTVGADKEKEKEKK